MYTPDNYFAQINSLVFNTLPEALRKGHDFVTKVTSNGTNWTNYHSSETIKKTINTYFDKLADFVGNTKKAAKTSSRKTKQKETAKEIMVEAMRRQGKSKASKVVSEHQPTMVERMPDEIRFIRRFVNLDGKSKTKEEVLTFLNSLQKSILEKKIRKTSPYAEQIRFIQDSLIETYNEMGAKIAFQLKPETLEALSKIAHDEKVMPSVRFIKRYINLNGKTGMKEKAKLLLGQINRAYEKGIVKDSDPYIIEMHEIKKNLETFISDKTVKVLKIEKNSLNGLEGILGGCSCNNLNGFDDDLQGDKPVIMNSMEFANMRFKTLGLGGKWLDLIGDPSTNFSIMVFGKPKMGKSYLCIDFAGYLARNHGKVLYVAKEEGLDKTLQDKLNDKEVKHQNLYVASALPDSLSYYDFIFLDSVNKLGLQPEELNRLKEMYPHKAFIYIFQTTKDGRFRGANTFQHDVDSVIEVPERGKAVQFGRFNQGGEIDIF
ncbi:MAG: DNA repair protein RadA [Pedobacter sp.]|nr:DNA repair protein RadA [Pedobacter sp.]